MTEVNLLVILGALGAERKKEINYSSATRRLSRAITLLAIWVAEQFRLELQERKQ